MSLSKNAIGSDLRKLLESGNFSDVAFRLADGTTFAGHRAIMAARCSYFASAFGTGTLTQFSEAEVKVIQVTHVPAAVFRLVMDFIYTDDVQLDHGNVWDVLQASEYYMLQGLQDLCEQYLSCQLDTVSGQSYAWAVDKLPQLWNAAAENGLAQLDAACRDFACTHFERVADSPGFFELAPSLLQQLLSRHAHQITVSAERKADVLPPLARLLADTQPQHAWKDLSAYRTFGSRPEFVQPRVTCHSTQLSLDGKLEFRSEHEVRRFHQGALDPAFTGPPLWETVDMRWVHACAPVLRKLDLTGCHHLPALHIRQLRECRELQWLSLSGCVLADDGAVKSVLRATVRLQTLLLEDLPLITNGVMAGMDDLYSLRELSLQGCARLTDEAFDKVGAYSWGWVWCDAIERVNLSRCPKVTHVGVAKLAQACTNLQQLIVEGSGATPAALAALCYRPGYPRLSIRLQPE
ncbi:hypothetical protein WJX72_008130 [[Myrmecia] bisecta]|uniref:BTB domain-containing protein n=1 Tax=[Myrmecia] bisecta TaxID=41462 RepID=A0AAW1PU60_9CHLO